MQLLGRGSPKREGNALKRREGKGSRTGEERGNKRDAESSRSSTFARFRFSTRLRTLCTPVGSSPMGPEIASRGAIGKRETCASSGSERTRGENNKNEEKTSSPLKNEAKREKTRPRKTRPLSTPKETHAPPRRLDLFSFFFLLLGGKLTHVEIDKLIKGRRKELKGSEKKGGGGGGKSERKKGDKLPPCLSPSPPSPSLFLSLSRAHPLSLSSTPRPWSSSLRRSQSACTS